MPQLDFFRPQARPWNTSRLIGAKPPLKPKHVWGIRQFRSRTTLFARSHSIERDLHAFGWGTLCWSLRKCWGNLHQDKRTEYGQRFPD